MPIRLPWEVALGIPVAVVTATALTFFASGGSALQAQGDPQSCDAPGHADPESPQDGGHEDHGQGLGLGHCDPQDDPPMDPTDDPPTDPSDLPSPAPPAGSGESEAPGDPVPVEEDVITETDSDTPATIADDPPTEEPGPPTLGEVLPAQDEPIPATPPTPPTNLPNAGSGGLAAATVHASLPPAAIAALASAAWVVVMVVGRVVRQRGSRSR